MEDFEKKVSLTDTEAMEPEAAASSSSSSSSSKSSNTLLLLRRFLETQQRRAQAYGFAEYMVSGGELAYQQLCSKITEEFNDCSKQVIEIESLFLKPEHDRDDLADLLRAIQTQEKQKLHLTATIQLLKKAGRPSERLVNHENCRFSKPMEHECVHLHEITEAAGTEEAEADAEYDNALKEAIRGVQDSVTTINEHLEEIKYEIAALEAQ
ncbi:DNA gyrase [Salix suchowensis]|nr:DNA gyrase [Salix suchowensis]